MVYNGCVRTKCSKLTPADAIRFRMEQGEHTQAELSKLLGSRSRASEYLSGMRIPSKRDALLIHENWGVPLDVLLRAETTISLG